MKTTSTLRISRYSLEYVFVPVSGTDEIPGLSHQVAIVETRKPVDTWHNATWDTDEAAVRILVRASADAPAGGDITLDVGRWDVYWRAEANPEHPARFVGSIAVF